MQNYSLEQSLEFAQQEREKYGGKGKAAIRSWLLKHIVEPGLVACETCEEPNKKYTILDFWGGGLFSDLVMDHKSVVKNQQRNVHLLEIDSDPRLKLALEAYCENHSKSVQNQGYTVSAHPGTLLKFCKNALQQSGQEENLKGVVKNLSQNVNFAWLDYCGALTLKKIEKDFAALAPLLAKDCSIAFTFLRGRDSFNPGTRQREMINLVKQKFPQHRLVREFDYKTGSNMTLYVFCPTKKGLIM